MKKYAIVLIDPQIGFCSRGGTLASAYGINEIIKIEEALADISKFLSLNKINNKALIKSEYLPGQFTDRKLNNPLSYLCVPKSNSDSEIIDNELEKIFENIFIKHEKSALSSKAFQHWVNEQIATGITAFIICGFLLEHCIKDSAIDLKRFISESHVEIIICQNLVASRLSKYASGEKSIVASAFKELERNGLKIINSNELQNSLNFESTKKSV